MTGTVHLVGAGPGDPQLLTLGALRAIQAADVILYDRLVSQDVLDLIPPKTHRIPVGKTPGDQHDVQRRIMWLMVAHARQGRTVVRLKGGDPFVYGRGSEEWEHLTANGIPVEVVPGITSALALPSLAGIPLTHRNVASSFAVLTGHRSPGPTGDFAPYAAIDTLVVLMGVTHRADIARQLVAAGRPATQPAAFIERGATPEERTIVANLADIAAGRVDVDPPAVLVVGDVVALRSRLAALEGADASTTRLPPTTDDSPRLNRERRRGRRSPDPRQTEPTVTPS